MFSSSDAGNQEQVRRICRFLNDALETAVRQQLGLPSTGITNVDDREFHESLWRAFRPGFAKDPPAAFAAHRRACSARPFPEEDHGRPPSARACGPDRAAVRPRPLPRRQAPRPT